MQFSHESAEWRYTVLSMLSEWRSMVLKMVNLIQVFISLLIILPCLYLNIYLNNQFKIEEVINICFYPFALFSMAQLIYYIYLGETFNFYIIDSFSIIIISIQFLSFFKSNFNIYFIFQISIGSYLVYHNLYRSFTTIFIDYYRYESLRFNIKHALLGLISNLAIIIFLIVDYFFIYANLVNYGFISIANVLRSFFCFILLSYYANSYTFLLVHYISFGDYFLGILLFIAHWILTTLLLNPVLEPDLFINI